MDQARSKGRGEVLDHVHEEVDESVIILVEGAAIDAVAEDSLGGRASISEEVGTSEETGKYSGSNKELKEGPEEIKGQEKPDQEQISDTLPVIDQGTSNNSNRLVNQEVLESVLVIESIETESDTRKLETKVTESGLSKVSLEAPKGASETDKKSCVIDIKCSSRKGFSENSEGERICRICHLVSGQPSDATAVSSVNSATTAVSTANSAASSDLIQLGCACKDELGIAHIHCAEAWFKLKGNRLCEICGETAKNVSGVADRGFMLWNERRFMENDGNSSRVFGGCWRGQPFCNYLMACLVLAFVMPWFFRVKMF